MVALAWLMLILLLAIVAPIFFELPLNSVDLSVTFREPVWTGGSWSYPLGTDNLGRDLLSQIAYGAQVSLSVAFVVAALSGIFGTFIGLATGYFGGWIDLAAARVIEAQLSLPVIIVALAIVISLGPSFSTVALAIALANWVPYARVIRSEVFVLRSTDFVALAQTAGLSSFTILTRHIFPNVLPSVVILASQTFGRAIIYEASLSYLGLGVQPPLVSWGGMIAHSQIYLSSNPWLVLIPTITLALTALAANVIGDRIRDSLDPASR